MKEEIKRIMKLVQEGKLSPEDAAELIDAFNAAPEGEETEGQRDQGTKGQRDQGTKGQGDQGTEGQRDEGAGSASDGPPPPPPGAVKDPFKGFVDWVEDLTKDVRTNVNWQDVSKQVREHTKKGVEGMKISFEHLKKGRYNFPWFGTYETREIQLPLVVPEGKVLKIENPCGDVRITGGHERGQVNATVRIRGGDEEEARENADAFTIVVEETEYEVRLRQHDVPDVTIDFDIMLAGPAAVDVKVDSGDLNVADTGGACKVHSNAGDVDLRGLDGAVDIVNNAGDVRVSDSKVTSLTLEGKAGDVHLSRIQGNINARSAAGDITVRECSGKTISVESISGDVHLDLIEPITGNVNVRTVNGDTHVAIADGSDCRVSLSTLRGNVHCDVVLTDEAKMEQHITGRLGDGTGSLDISAVNGDVTMQIREHMATAAE